ncbi:response regulator transcription factor [Tunturibacter empetritectus]|uniref:DNA-binding NarL/FixJ family response regulator n=1 Tax=Tunturiibacter empetritectus TaxID=3069691 RepID=A0A7W8MQQ0_9BACT|nr:response regulator transcription factor [Edaphobacter lichenicola]MBB5316045.1 DNA-binding NarL/FixJ family response regulator [Edaphobacter lichenicola]
MSTQHTPEDNTLVQERVKNAPLRIMIVDDHPMVREGLAGILERQEMVIVGVAATGRQAIEMFAQYLPDILLLDLRLPDQSGIKVMRKILADRPDAKIIFLSSSQGDASIFDAISNGASGYLVKGIDGATLGEGIRRVWAGGRCLSPEAAEKLSQHVASKKLSEREIEVLQLISKGNSNKEIARLLFVTEDTIKMHVKKILGKLPANDRTQAVVIAIQRGLLDV